MPTNNIPTQDDPIVNVPLQDDPINNPIDEPIAPEMPSPIDNGEQQAATRTYSDAEVSNPNAIDVVIADYQTPIAVLFGPPACGKTMTMIRLAEYLSSKGYSVEPVRSFRKNYDTNYRANCDNFNSMLNNQWAAEKSLGLNFMLLNVSKGGNPIVQILEAPGEHYYNPNDANEPRSTFISYIQKVINASNKKLWIYLTEPDWKNQSDRRNYATKVATMKRNTSRADKSILLFNKVDTTNLVVSMGEVNEKQAAIFVNQNYPGLFECFKNTNPITSLWKPYACTLVPFTTGTYDTVLDNGEEKKKYTPGPDIYPKKLWNTILKSIGRPQIN